jgi:hypothetical protein
MTDPNYTRIYALLDRSGSMGDIKRATEEGFDGYISAQKDVPGRCDVTLVQFDAPGAFHWAPNVFDFHIGANIDDDWYKVIYRNKPIQQVPKLQLVPRGGTALHDALGRLITEAGQELAALPEDKRPGVVEVLVLTDGEENSSTHWHIESLRSLVGQQKKTYSWRFVFMGSNQDAVLTGTRLGFDSGTSLTYTGDNVVQAFASAATSSGLYRSGIAKGVSVEEATRSSYFTEDDREKSVSNSK